jgi:hypothetical protein
MMKKLVPYLAFMAVVGMVGPGFGQYATIDYYGYAWEDGGFPPSDPGDELWFTGVAVTVAPIFGVDLSSEELTFYMHGLISTGEVPIGGGNVMISYTGGMLEIYRDAAMNADWGVSPPNATSPPTFVDGSLYFSGSFTSMTVYMTPDGYGAYEGTLDGIGGEMITSVCNNCVYTWGGTFTPATGAQIPDGYDLQVDGVFEIEEAVGTDETTWGAVKALFK